MSTEEAKQHPIDIQIGERIRKRRLVCGLSQKKIAEKLGVSFQQIQRYEGGITRVIVDRLYELAEALSVDISYFFTNTSEDVHDKEKYPFHYGNCDIGSEELSRLVREYRKIEDEKLRSAIHLVIEAFAKK